MINDPLASVPLSSIGTIAGAFPRKVNPIIDEISFNVMELGGSSRLLEISEDGLNTFALDGSLNSLDFIYVVAPAVSAVGGFSSAFSSAFDV